MSAGPHLLDHAPLFEGLEPDALAAIERAARVRSVDRGACFFHQGDPAEALHVLVSGAVKMTQVDAAGHQVVPRVIKRGDMFGCAPVLSRSVYPATADALVDSYAWIWDCATLQRLFDAHPALARNALRVVGARLNELQDRLLEVASIRVEQRLARTLLRLVRQAGKRVDEGVAIDMPLSRQDLAELCGTTLFSVSRTLSRWESEGLVIIGRHRVTIVDRHGVVTIAEDL
ncbi:MAG: Crp/Fnr family transcriptional regulator [Deltaproteobacteria bacterium]|nr:MAG: Crp/Fnr family transcriptional regulator [Deltaproteobacteria bacterium]